MPETIQAHPIEVLDLIAEGQTNWQVARQLEVEKRSVDAARLQLQSIFQTRSAAVMVDKAIKSNQIGYELQPDEAITSELSDNDVRVLGFYAKGGNNHQLAEATKVPRDRVESYQDRLFKKVKAWNLPHAVKRSYELGIFVVGTQGMEI